MNIDVKCLVREHLKLLVFLAGVIGGLLFSMMLTRSYRDVKVVYLDLNKIIKTYAVVAAKTGQSSTAFMEQFNTAMAQISPKIIVVNKGQLLSPHESRDYTKEFIENMGFNNLDKQKPN